MISSLVMNPVEGRYNWLFTSSMERQMAISPFYCRNILLSWLMQTVFVAVLKFAKRKQLKMILCHPLETIAFYVSY